MPQAYSLDLRERVLKDCDGGLSSEAVAKNITSVPPGAIHCASNAVKPETSPPKNTNEAGKINEHPTNKKCDNLFRTIPMRRSLNFMHCCPIKTM